MTISGFTFVKNTDKFYYPFVESILSILPIVDEFVVVVGDSDPDDTTLAQIEAIDSDKIKIFHSVWEPEKYAGNGIYAQQTDVAMQYCTGDWLFYLQSDELVHEKYLDTIVKACEAYHNDDEVEGLLFKYRHFWGDYDHYHQGHGWYKREIRMVKRLPNLHSWRDAQSFRFLDKFDGKDYFTKEGTRKLKVALIDAYIYHYGWVRPPAVMKMKTEHGKVIDGEFDYGPLCLLAEFKEEHPALMKPWLEKLNWQDKLYHDKPEGYKPFHRHERFRIRLHSWLEGVINGHDDEISGFHNYIQIKKFKG
jgi:glycosyltransferase involved in cell wall biosynthesis